MVGTLAQIGRHVAELAWAAAIVERIDEIFPRCRIEGLHQFPQFVRMLFCQIGGFGNVKLEVVQGPVVHVHRRVADLQRTCQPAGAIVGAVGPAFVVLLAARRRGVAQQHLRAAHAVQGARRLAMTLLQARHAGHVEQGRHHVGDMHELAADGAEVLEPGRPGSDERDAPPAAAGIGLEAGKRGVRHLAPGGGIERNALRAAQLRQHAALMLQRLRGQAGIAPVVEHHAVFAARIGAAVVGGKQDDGVVEFADRFEEGHELADILVGVVEHAGEGFHVARIERPIGGVGVVPVRRARVGGGQSGVGRNQAHLDLALVTRGARGGPAGVVLALVLCHVGGLGLQRRVHGVVGHIEEERFGRIALAQLAHEADALVHPVVAGVVVARVFVDRQDLIVQHQAGREKMVGLAVHEAVVGVEAALTGPVVLRSARHIVGGRRVVPFADHDGFVAGGAQGLGQGRGGERDFTGIARIAGVVVGQPAGTHRMGVAAGQQRRARRRADGMGGVVGQAHAASGQGVDVRRVDLGAVTAGVGPAHVVHENDHDVGRTFLRGAALWPPGRGFLAGTTYGAAEFCCARAHRLCLVS